MIAPKAFSLFYVTKLSQLHSYHRHVLIITLIENRYMFKNGTVTLNGTDMNDFVMVVPVQLLTAFLIELLIQKKLSTKISFAW